MNTETYDFEDRKYINPTVSRDEQLGFIDNLRDAQQQGLDQIVSETHNLGTDVPSSVGGLNGATGMWQSQYMTPKMNTMVSSMRATAQAQALSDILSNYQNQMKQRYNEAYRAYQLKDAQNKASSSSGGNGISLNDGVKTKSDGSGSKKTLEEIDVNSPDVTNDELDVVINDKQAQLDRLKRERQQVQDKWNIEGQGSWNDFWMGRIGGLFDWARWDQVARQDQRTTDINNLEKEINDLKAKKK